MPCETIFDIQLLEIFSENHTLNHLKVYKNSPQTAWKRTINLSQTQKVTTIRT